MKSGVHGFCGSLCHHESFSVTTAIQTSRVLKIGSVTGSRQGMNEKTSNHETFLPRNKGKYCVVQSFDGGN